MHDANIVKRMKAGSWKWADKDPAAAAELTRRIAAAGRERKLIAYSDLVNGVVFRVPTIQAGTPYSIDIGEWEGLDRALIGEFLGLISTDSYRAGGFFATAIVVSKGENKPSDHFFDWTKVVGVLPNLKEDTVLAFWAQQVVRAHEFYKDHDHH